MTRFADSKFSVGVGDSKRYRDNWERIFNHESCTVCEGEGCYIITKDGKECLKDCAVCGGLGYLQ